MVKISVIVPCYNVEDYLEECLDSIINQTFRDIEIICINDGSTDNTLNILNEYAKKDNRIRIISQSNKGLSMARNVALENITGEYVTFIDSDDYIELTTFEELLKITEDKSLDLLIFKLINFDNETHEQSKDSYFEMNFVKDIVGENIFTHEDIGEKFYYMSVTAPGKLYKYDLLKDIRFPHGLIFEDNPFFIEVMFRAERVYFYDRYLYHRRIRDTSITQSSTDMFYHIIEIHNIIIDITKEYGFFDKYQVMSYRRKISDIHRYLQLINEEDKPSFFEKMKEDYKRFEDEYKSNDAFYRIPRRLQDFFNFALECETYEEYDLKTANYDLYYDNYEIRKENEKLKEEINSLKEFNNCILTSKSWKITKPLRKLKNMTK